MVVVYGWHMIQDYCVPHFTNVVSLPEYYSINISSHTTLHDNTVAHIWYDTSKCSAHSNWAS